MILYRYLNTIQLRTVMHFTLRGYPQSGCIDIYMRLDGRQTGSAYICLSLQQLAGSDPFYHHWPTHTPRMNYAWESYQKGTFSARPDALDTPRLSTKTFVIDIYTIVLRPVMQFTFRGYPQSYCVSTFT